MPGPNVSIIGAGPAGLTVAYFLTKNNISLVIYESGKEIGGLAGSVNLWGKTFDIGPHIFLESSQPEAVNFWKETGGADLQRLTLSRGMILKQRLIRYPPSPGGLIRAIGVLPFLQAGMSVLKAKLSKVIEVKSSGDFFRNCYGNYFRKLVFNPFCEKYMGLPDSLIDRGFATGLTSFVKEAGKTDVQPEKEKLKTLLYHKQGTKKMWSLIAEKILEKNEILFEKKLTKIITEGNCIKRLCFNDGSSIDPDFVISTLPVTTFLRLLDNCPAEILDEIKNLTSRNTVLVYLHLSASAFLYQYVTIFDHSLSAGRITNFNSWQLPTNNKDTVLCVEYWCDNKDVHWTFTDDEITEKAIKELENAGILNSKKIIATEVFRIPNSHPVLNTDYAIALKTINNYIENFKNLALTGRHATFKWDGQADNIIAGMRLAEKITNFFK